MHSDFEEDSFQIRTKRFEVEHEERWSEWIHNMPSLHFEKEWGVQVIPPFGGALARFYIVNNGRFVSVYFDPLNRLGIYGADKPEPYFEMYPYDGGDVQRYGIDETDEMMKDIRKVLNG